MSSQLLTQAVSHICVHCRGHHNLSCTRQSLLTGFVLLLVLLVQVMGAGHETTATTTAAALYCISAHPAVEQQLVAELQSVLGARAPTYEDLEHLPYLQVWFGPHGALLLLLLLSILDFALKLLCLFAIMILRQ
jgi:hypothetical protein